MKRISTLLPVVIAVLAITITSCTKQNVSTAANAKQSATADSTGKNVTGQPASTTTYPDNHGGNCGHNSGNGYGG